MSSDPNQIRADIEATRTDLSANVDALTHRASPRRAMTAPVHRARGRLARVMEKVMGTAHQARETGGHRAAGAAHQTAGAVSSAGQHATGAAHQAAGALSSAGQHATGAAHQAAGALASAGQHARALPETSKEHTQGNPLAAGLIAFGVGLLASSLIPPSNKEQRVAGRLKQEAQEHSGQLRQQASGLAHQAQDNMREPLQHAGETLRSTATQGVAQVRDETTEAAQNVRGEARDSQHRLTGNQ